MITSTSFASTGGWTFKSTEDSLTLLSESVGEKQKEEPEIVVAPLESTEESGTATEEPPAEDTAQVLLEVEPLLETPAE